MTRDCQLCGQSVVDFNPLRKEQGYCLHCETELAWDQEQTLVQCGNHVMVAHVPTNGYGIRRALVWPKTPVSQLEDLDGAWANIKALKPGEELGWLAIPGKLKWEHGYLLFEAFEWGDYDAQRLNAAQKHAKLSAQALLATLLPKAQPSPQAA